MAFMPLLFFSTLLLLLQQGGEVYGHLNAQRQFSTQSSITTPSVHHDSSATGYRTTSHSASGHSTSDSIGGNTGSSSTSSHATSVSIPTSISPSSSSAITGTSLKTLETSGNTSFGQETVSSSFYLTTSSSSTPDGSFTTTMSSLNISSNSVHTYPISSGSTSVPDVMTTHKKSPSSPSNGTVSTMSFSSASSSGDALVVTKSASNTISKNITSSSVFMPHGRPSTMANSTTDISGTTTFSSKESTSHSSPTAFISANETHKTTTSPSMTKGQSSSIMTSSSPRTSTVAWSTFSNTTTGLSEPSTSPHDSSSKSSVVSTINTSSLPMSSSTGSSPPHSPRSSTSTADGIPTSHNTASIAESSTVTAAPGSTKRTTLTPATIALGSVTFSLPSVKSSTSPQPTEISLKTEIDEDTDDLDNLIILIGVWTKSPVPNPPDIMPVIDAIIPDLESLKNKLPQAPENDPECEKTGANIDKRFWPFDIVGNTVKNAVQCVAKIGVTATRLRSQLIKGAIDGAMQDLVDLRTLTNAMKKYDPRKDPCVTNRASYTSSSASSSHCSTRTVSNCNVVCTVTVTTTPFVGSKRGPNDLCTTTCGLPMMTCGAASRTSTSTFTTTTTSRDYCDNTCCKTKPDHTPWPIPTAPTTPTAIRGLHKRSLPSKDGYPWYGNMFNFMRDMCNDHSLIPEMFSRDPDTVPTTSEQWVLGSSPKNICFPGLYGCSMLIVVSHEYVWMAHFIENRSGRFPEKWAHDILWPIEFGGYGSDIPAGLGLRDLGQPHAAFAPGTNPQAFIVSPLDRRDDENAPQPQTFEYINLIVQIEAAVHRILPHAGVTRVPYVANAAQFWSFQHHHLERFVDEDWRYFTPFGKILVTYDNNIQNAPRGCQLWTGWQVWAGDVPYPFGGDQSPATPFQVPDGWSKRQNHEPLACPLHSSSVPTATTSVSGSLSRSSASSAIKSTASTRTSLAATKSSASASAHTVRSSTTSSSTRSISSKSAQSSTALKTSTMPFNTPIPARPSPPGGSVSSKSTSSGSMIITTTMPFNTPMPARPSSSVTSRPDIVVQSCGDKDCDCCGRYSDECARLWCPTVGKTGKDCEDYCFSEQCLGSSPTVCVKGNRCHRPTCPDKKGDPPKKIKDPSPIIPNACSSSTDCGCCKDFFNKCIANWLPSDVSGIAAYTFCVSEMCYNDQSPDQCRNNPGGCSLKVICPDKKGEKPKGPVPGQLDYFR